MWCVESDPYVVFAAVKDFQDFEQQQEFVEGKSLMHPHLPNTTCILITLLSIYCFASI
jgi:hypothetical protein